MSLETQASGSVFNEVTKVPVTNPKKLHKKNHTTKARCIMENEFIEELKEEKRKKAKKKAKAVEESLER